MKLASILTGCHFESYLQFQSHSLLKNLGRQPRDWLMSLCPRAHVGVPDECFGSWLLPGLAPAIAVIWGINWQIFLCNFVIPVVVIIMIMNNNDKWTNLSKSQTNFALLESWIYFQNSINSLFNLNFHFLYFSFFYHTLTCYVFSLQTLPHSKQTHTAFNIQCLCFQTPLFKWFPEVSQNMMRLLSLFSIYKVLPPYLKYLHCSPIFTLQLS